MRADHRRRSTERDQRTGPGMLAKERGFTIIEMVVVILMLGVVAAIVLPRSLKSTPTQEVDRAARQLTQDLELVRMRAIAAKRVARLEVDADKDFYTAFMDTTEDREGTIVGTENEFRMSGLVARGSEGGIPGVELPSNLGFGCGNASAGPLSFDCGGDPVQLGTDGGATFDTRGMLTPLGTTGVVYLEHSEDPDAVAAVTLSGGGAFSYWRYRGGSWVK